jgi:hypothetical protein
MLSVFKLTKDTTLSETIRLSIVTHEKLTDLVVAHLNDLVEQYGFTSVKGRVVYRLAEELRLSRDLNTWNLVASLVSDILDMYSHLIKTVASDNVQMTKALSDTVLELAIVDSIALPRAIRNISETLTAWPKPH